MRFDVGVWGWRYRPETSHAYPSRMGIQLRAARTTMICKRFIETIIAAAGDIPMNIDFEGGYHQPLLAINVAMASVT